VIRVARLLVRRARRVRAAVRWAVESRWRVVRIALTRPAPRDRLRVYYGHDRMPGLDERATGGLVKFQRLQSSFPNAPRDFNVLYLGSSSILPDSGRVLRLARRRGAAIAWNQNGVGYHGWHGPGFEVVNAPMIEGLRAADHVFYQSEFCKLGADLFLGPPAGTSEVLYNAVDTRSFTPDPSPRREGPLTLVLGGSQYQRYRVEIALETVAALARGGTDVRLLVTGPVSWSGDSTLGARWALEEAARLGVADRVELVGPYVQVDAPAVLRRGDLLLHTKYNDPCPVAVLEAMACGLPVVYSASGGLPELVGDEAGIGIPAPLDWEQDPLPDPAALAEAVVRVAERLDEYSEAARARAVERFDILPWIARHEQVFEEVLAR